MNINNYLLNTDQMMKFVIYGFITIKTDLDSVFHEHITKQLDIVNKNQPNPRSGIIDAVPDLHKVYECPPVKGALHSILGHDMKMHYYTLSHCNPPGFPGQLWHQGSAKNRPNTIWRLMVFYFPHDVHYEMGPTVIAPGTQYRKVSNTDLHRYGSIQNQLPIVVDGGTVLIMHYDIWHRGTANQSNRTRYMVKTVFERTSIPRMPSWNQQTENDLEQTLREFRKIRIPIDNEAETYKHQEIWINIWKWMHGLKSEDADWFPAYLP